MLYDLVWYLMHPLCMSVLAGCEPDAVWSASAEPVTFNLAEATQMLSNPDVHCFIVFQFVKATMCR